MIPYFKLSEEVVLYEVDDEGRRKKLVAQNAFHDPEDRRKVYNIYMVDIQQKKY